jgi:hypothetical protein
VSVSPTTPNGDDLWEHQGVPLTPRELISVLLSRAVDLDAPLLVGVYTPDGGRDLVTPFEVEVLDEQQDRAAVLWIGASPKCERRSGLVFEL